MDFRFVSQGARGLSAAQQLYQAGLISAPTIAAMDAYLRAAGDEAGGAADQVRQATEAERLATVTVRTDTDAVRVATEQVRVDTLQMKNDTDAVRAATETVRQNTEAVRVATETVRGNTEAVRVATDQERIDTAAVRAATNTSKQAADTATGQANTARDYANAQGDYAKAQGELATAKAVLAQAVVDAGAQTLAARDAAAVSAASALANASLPANNSNPNLYVDPELEYQTVGGTMNWGSTALLVVSTANAKRLRTPSSASALGIIDSAARQIPVSQLPNGRVSMSVVIARKDATANAADLRFRLLAYNASNQSLAWPDVTGSDEASQTTYYGKYVPAAAITSPVELVVAQNLALPVGTSYLVLMIRVETTATMDFSHITVRNGADPHYRALPVSPKTVSDTSAVAQAAQGSVSSLALARALIDASSYAPNLYADPEFENLTVGATQSWTGTNMTVVSQSGAKRLRTPSAAGGAIGMVDTSTIVPIAQLPSGKISASVMIARKDAQTAGSDIRFRLIAKDSGGTQLTWPSYTGADEPGANVWSKYAPLAAISTLTELVIAENVQLPANTATVQMMVRVDTAATVDFSHITLRDGADPHYRAPRLSAKALSDAATAAAAAQATANGIGSTNSNPNLYPDPELEYYNVGDNVVWGGGNLAVVSTAGAKRMRTAGSATPLGVLDATARRMPIANFPSGRMSASIIVARKDATTLPTDLRFRMYAYDAGGTALNWAADATLDESNGNLIGRNMPVGAITAPTEIVIARNVLIPANAATIGIGYRTDTMSTMDFSHVTVRDGNDPHYQAPRVSAKTVLDLAAIGTPAAKAYVEDGEVALGLVTAQPNLFTQAQLDFTDTAVSSKSTGMTVAAGTSGGVPALSFSVPAAGTGWAYWLFNRATALPGATAISASFCVMGLDASSGGTARVLLRQMNGAAEISASRVVMQIATDGSAVVGPKHFRAANVVLDANCTDVQLYVEVNAGSSGARAVYIRDMLVAAGGNPAFRRPPVTASSLGIISAAPEDFADLASQLPNRFTAAELDVQSMRYAGGNVNTLTASTYGNDKRPVWSFSNIAGAAEKGVYFGAIPRADLDNGSNLFSVALQVYSSDAYVGANGGQVTRILIVQRDNTNTEIAGTRATLTSSTGGVATPTWFRQAGIALHANTTTVLLYIGVANVGGTADRTIKFGDMMIAAGSNAVFRRPPTTASVSTGGGVLFIAPTGVDTAAGTLAAPMATAQAAANKMGGAGTIIAIYGTYTQAQMRISPSTLTGKLTILGKRSSSSTGYDNYPVVYCADKLTGITKTASFTKVYQVQLTAPPTLANFNWAYQDGVADPRTVIPVTERSPQHRGRANRLHWATKLVKTTATTLAAAQAEIDASDNNDPKAFIDDSTGIMYFSIVGGGDGTAANIYLDNPQGLFSTTGSLRESAPELLIVGLEVRYGGIDCSFFRRAHFDEVFVFGGANNCVYYSVLSYGTLECACSGSQAGLVGDGLNGHIGAKITSGLDYYGHDCRDDGYSDHEGASSRMHGGLVEYNGGTGCAPAYGCDDVIINMISRKNQQRGTYKKAGMYVTGAPSAGASGGDGGYDSNAVFINCISIGDIIGFADDGASTGNVVRAICINCKVYDQTGAHGYDVYEMRDCGWSSGTGIARRADRNTTIVKNTALVA